MGRFLSINEATEELGIGRTQLYEELASGRLTSVRIGRRRLIPISAIDAYVDRLLADQNDEASTQGRGI